MVFLWHLPDDSAFKQALRDNDWDEQQYVLGRIATEISFLRADQAALHGQRMRPQPVLSPAERRHKREAREFQRDLHDMLVAQMSGEFVPPKRETDFVSEHVSSVKKFMDEHDI